MKTTLQRRSAPLIRWLSVAATVALWLSSGRAHAQDPADLPPPAGERGALTAGAEPRHEYWDCGTYRPFAAASLEMGVVYLRPSLAFGYGKPHYQWVGLEGYGYVASRGGAEYIGLRGVLPRVDLRFGARYQYPVNQYFLTPRDSYTREQVELDEHGRSRYVSVETELAASLPIPHGSLFAVATGYGIFGTPPNVFVLEEGLKVIVDPPFLWRARLGYLAAFGWYDERPDNLRLGIAAEVIHSVSRGAVIVRTGPLLSVTLTDHLEAIGAMMLVVASPDTVGLLGADFGTLGLRYRWATGDPTPAFP